MPGIYKATASLQLGTRMLRVRTALAVFAVSQVPMRARPSLLRRLHARCAVHRVPLPPRLGAKV